MLARGPIANSLILLAAAGLLSACTAHHHGHGTVYRPHDHGVRTGPTRTHTTTRTTVIAPRHGMDGRPYYRKGRRYQSPGQHAPPVTAKRPHPPAHGLRGTQPSRHTPPVTAKRPHPPAHGLRGTQPGRLKHEKGPKMPVAGAARTPHGRDGQPRTQNARGQKSPHTVSSAMNELQKKPRTTIPAEPQSTILTD